MNGPSQRAGHVFISYVREDAQQVDRLQGILEAAGIQVWRDTADLWPGQDWRFMIRRAITDNALVFIACFSANTLSRSKTFQNEELALAIDQLRLRRPEEPWLIPVRFDECEIPDRDLGGGRTLASIQWADLFGDKYEATAKRLVASILRILGRGSQPDLTTSSTASQQRLANGASVDKPDHGRAQSVISWQLDADEYDQTVVNLFRQRDDIPLRQMLFELPGQASSLLGNSDSGKLNTLLDRLASTGGLAIQFGRKWWLDRVLETLVAIYELGFDASGYERGDQATVLLWLEVVERVHALGGLAVRVRDWPTVRSLADQQPEGDSLRYDFGSWLQHAPVMAARANLLDRPSEKENGIIARSNHIARTVKALHPDRSPDSEVILSSICQFDVLGCLAVVAGRQNITPGNFFPSFARYRSRRSEPAFRQIISDPEMRREIFRGDDRLLADALSAILKYAGKEAFWYPSWDGINDPVVTSFIAEHRTAPEPEP